MEQTENSGEESRESSGIGRVLRARQGNEHSLQQVLLKTLRAMSLRVTEIGEDPNCICTSKPSFGCIEVKLFKSFPKSWWESTAV